MKILAFFANIMVAYAAYSISNWGLDGSETVCLSNESPLEGLVHYWENGIKKRKMDRKIKNCKIGSEPLKTMDNRTVMSIIEQVQLSITNLRLTCASESGLEGVYVDFNGLDDTEAGRNIVDCENFKIISELGIDIGDGYSWVAQYNGSYAKEIREKDEIIKKLREGQENADILMRDDKNEILSLIRENQMLQHRISNLTGVVYNFNNSLRALENDLALREQEHRKVRAEAEKNHVRKGSQEKGSHSDFIKLKSVLTSALVATTVLPMVTASSQTNQINTLNPYIHAKNRVHGGVFRYETDEDETCRGLNYGAKCVSFDHMLKPYYYPFFNSHVMHMTPLEAYVENELTEDENSSCEMGKGKSNKCLEGRSYMRGHCPIGITGVHYINDKGKIVLSKCSGENHEITEDCMFCRQIKRNSGEKGVVKTSVSLQDAICQKDSMEYSGPRISIKGVCSIGNMEYKKCSAFTQNYENVPFVVFKGKGKYYLEKLIINNVELVGNVSFICHKHKGQDNESQHREYKKTKLSDCGNVETGKTEVCTGDHVFCQKYTCSTASPSAKCFVAPGSGPVFVNIMGSWVKPQCVGYENVLVRRESKTSRPFSISQCRTCVYECGSSDITITSTGFEITSAVSCSHGSCVSTHQSPSTSVKIPYPGLVASTGGDIGIHLSHTGDTAGVHMIVHCPSRDVCETHHCFFCLKGILNYQCHTILTSIISSTMISLLFYVAFSLVGKLLYFFHLIPKKLRSPLMWIWLLTSYIVSTIYKSYCGLKRRINVSIGWSDRPNQVALSEVRVGRAIPRFDRTMFIILLLLPLALSCSESLIANSKQIRCVQDKSSLKCSVTATVTLKAGVIGAESCFILKGPIEGQHKTIMVKTISSEVVCREGNSFWTSHYMPVCLSSRRCHLVGECHKNRCQSWADREVSREFKGVSDNGIMSENKCFEQCGALGCGCFNINPSCLFVHSYLKSTRNEAVRVFSCADWVHRLNLEVTGPDGEKDIVVLGSLGTKFLSWGTISLSLDAEGITGTNAISFLESSKGGFALYDEALSEMPREGFLGEIRCSSESAAIMAHSSCLRAPNLIKYKPMTDIIDCTASLVDPFAAFTKGSLPQVRNGMTFTSSMDKKTVQAFNSGSIKAMITINMDDHEIQFLSDFGRCESSFINITGCYSCDYGARVCVRVNADKPSVYLARQENNEFFISLKVEQGTNDYCQILHFNSPNVEEKMKYSCGAEEKLLNIKGILISLGVSDLRNQTGGHSTVVNPRETNWNLGGWASGLFSWLGGTWTGILKILGFLLLGLIIILLVVSLSKRLIFSTFIKTKVK
ncbi:polyprotein [Maldonado virus]|uniref:Envelopment polyprotein n=1 Tax=Maldonado virus TaxID=1004889 RepID=F2W3Q9_9VIRU|nr:polyprotein [Maldonado virus]AEA30043.1 polyprotein [Maldonado virus]